MQNTENTTITQERWNDIDVATRRYLRTYRNASSIVGSTVKDAMVGMPDEARNTLYHEIDAQIHRDWMSRPL